MRPVRDLFLSLLVLATSACTNADFASQSGKGSDSGKEQDPPGEDPGGTGGNGRDARKPGDLEKDSPPRDGPIDPEKLGEGEGSLSFPDDCDEDGATQTKLLSDQVPNGQPGNEIRYQVFLTDCEGNLQRIRADKVEWDIDARSEDVGEGKALAFSVEDPETGSVLDEGKLEEIAGRDLFGKTGDKYYHNRTEKDVALPEGTKSFVITVKLEGNLYRPLDPNAPIPDDALPLDTFLRFGDAAPVKVPVPFVGTPKEEPGDEGAGGFD